MEKLPQIEELIQVASGFLETLEASCLCLGECFQQKNINDCGVVATYNAIELLMDELSNKYRSQEASIEVSRIGPVST